MRSTLRAAVLAALVLLAGCAGGTGVPGTDGATPGTAETLAAADGSATTPGGGVVRFYISDQPAAIEDFRHLNVTVSRVGIQRGGENGNWSEYEVGGRTVDLTRLRGDNATLVGEFPLENGTYTKVFVHVSAVEGVLENGERVNVKLPSEKLQINERFTIGPNESVDFVFDIAVHKAGKSGKYILRPVIAESGTDVPIDEVDEDDEREDEDDDADDREDDDAEDEEKRLNVTLVGNATPGEDATVRVTANGTPVANASVSVNGDPAGTTDADGRLTFGVPADAEELELEARHGEREGELEVEYEAESGG